MTKDRLDATQLPTSKQHGDGSHPEMHSEVPTPIKESEAGPVAIAVAKTLRQKIEAFDSAKHGGEFVVTRSVGREKFSS